MTSPKLDVRKRFLKLAYNQLNPNLTSLEGIEQALSNWYCFQYNVPPNDDKLLSMTLEELLVLHQMHKLKESPELAEEINPEFKSYEEWLQTEMGDEYVSIDDMVKKAEELDKEEKVFEEQLPDRITTDFTQFRTEE